MTNKSLIERIEGNVTNGLGYERDSNVTKKYFFNEPIANNTYIDLQRKLLHMEYTTGKKDLKTIMFLDNELLIFKNDFVSRGIDPAGVIRKATVFNEFFSPIDPTEPNSAYFSSKVEPHLINANRDC